MIQTLLILRPCVSEKAIKRIPRGYDGQVPTGRNVKDLADTILGRISHAVDGQPQNVFNTFTALLSDTIRPLVKPISFRNGKLVVKVKNGTLLSILSSQEKGRLLRELRFKMPHVEIQNIVFQIG